MLVMASSKVLPFLAILVLLPAISMADISLSPSPSMPYNLSTYYQQLCEEVECGKGTCVGNITYPLNYKCVCDPGWTQTPDLDEDYHEFLPCVIPNCTLNYGSCQPAPPPVPEKEVPFNISVFDPCYWTYCGEGTCTRNGTYGHLCTCNPGFYNLLNVSYFPCYSDCTIGSDCASLGVRVSNSTSTSSPGGDGSHATSVLPGKLHWLIISLLSMVMVLRM